MAKTVSLKLDDRTYWNSEKIRRKAISHYNSLYARKLVEREYSNASQRLGAAHFEYLKATELLEQLPEDL